MVEIKKLPASRWKVLRDIRLNALQTEPHAFGSSYGEEKSFTQAEWKRRIKNTLFAFSDEEVAGLIVYLINSKIKQKHIVNFYGVYVKRAFRNRRIGTKLLESAIEIIKRKPGLVKISLQVNPKQTAAVKLYEKHGFKIAGTLKSSFSNIFREYSKPLNKG
jgi:ribosomal protein S18 acetylase RimI-like enzyme